MKKSISASEQPQPHTQYEQLKKRAPLPDHVKYRIQVKAKRQDPKLKSSFMSFKSWTALASAVLVLITGINIFEFGLAQNQMPIVQSKPQVSLDEAVTIQVIEPNLATRLSAEIITDRQAYLAFKASLQSQMAKLNNDYNQAQGEYEHYAKMAHLHQENKDVKLTLCDDTIKPVYLKDDQINKSFDALSDSESRLVQLVFNRQGKIVLIKNTSNTSC
ncbi:hypothetical protein [Algibacillus agarilyticus]|uniref:hypothetical protein n=1 Tax=Algibacillus agarilyticus TaxID=2234133 RepID=UPI000DCF6DEE|nr:hypothetical protein [Algibacillus agarilyticus]